MNLNSLDHFLMTLSEREVQYKNGAKFEYWNKWDSGNRQLIDGREVIVIQNQTEAPFLYGLPWNQKHIDFSIPDLPISVKRTSRFNPVPEHIHSYLEINYVYSGQCPQRINQTPITLQKNQVLLIDTNCPHSIESLGENDVMISILIEKSFLHDHMFSQFSKDSILSRFFIHVMDERTSHNHYLLFHSENNRRIPMFFQEFFCEFFDPSINSSDILTHLFYLIMAELINVYENDIAKSELFTSAGQIAPMIRYIEKNFQTCTLDSVAEIFHLSPNYISSLLKRYTKMNFIQLTQSLKLDYAARLLKSSDLTVTEIANEAGYENVSFFYKKFQAKFHCSPKDYRTEKKT